MPDQKLIGTHNGKFHCDEVFACYMLRKLPRFANHGVVRSRDPKVLDMCDVVVDVGGIYSHAKKRYDHHQRGFTETLQTVRGLPFETKLSSAGLIYAHYGEEVIASILGLEEKDPDVEKLYVHLYKVFVEAVDAIDNGIQQFDEKPRYQLSSTLTSRVNHCNPSWNTKHPDPEKGFEKAMEIVAEEFEGRVHYLYDAWLPARHFVQETIEKREKVHPSGKILMFDQGGGLPWKEHFFQLEKELSLESVGICLAIYQDSTDLSWRLQSIPVSETSGFDNRILLPWKGFRDADLEKESGIQGAKFVHISGFLGGAKTVEGAMKMAEETLKQKQKL